MKRLSPWILLALWMAGAVGAVSGAERNGKNPMEASLVTLDVTAKNYDYFQPWTKPTRSVRKHALVVGERELMTTAQNLADHTLVRAQKGGRGRWLNAEVKWVDYHANVALVTVADEGFWAGLKPVELAERVPKRDDYEVIRWRDGNLEIRRADFSKFTVGDGSLSFAPRIHLELNTEISGLGWAEPVMSGGMVVGLTVAKGGNVCTIMPAPFIRRIVEAQRSGRFAGLGYFDFVWQQGENPATIEYLKVPGEPRGAVVIEIPKSAGADYALKREDVIVEIDGFGVDMDGDYEDPEYGHLMIEGLATRRHFAGEKIPMKVARGGQILDIEYVIPKAAYSVDLLPMFNFDAEPEYLVAGGLVFQPLTQAYLRGWGDEWRRRAPFRLVFFNNQPPSAETPALVVLSQVLPDPINVGYQEFRNLAVDKINGQTVRRLADVKNALQAPKDGAHLIEFFRGDGLQRMLLDSESLEDATQRVLERYGIPAAEVLVTEDLASKPAANGQDVAASASTQRTPTVGSPLTALDRYVHTPDPAYGWKVAGSVNGDGGTAYYIDMTSQDWLTTNEVNRTTWRHWLVVARPTELKHSTALLFIGGGGNKDNRPPKVNSDLVRIAKETHSVVAELRMVPNQPLVFGGDGEERVEDNLIGYTWDKFLRTGDEKWPARLPMTKAAVRAMDTLTAFCASDAGGGAKVDTFVVAGGSKRGWTTWTTAAVDRRVVSICPIVIDVLNMSDSMIHHYKAYGFWAPAVGDYVHHGIMDWMKTPEMRKLEAIEDPFSYRDRLTIPKLVLNACGDQFFLPDSSQFYFDELKGPKYLRYVPNADHSLKGSDAYETLLAWHQVTLNAAKLPRFTWKHGHGGEIQVQAADTPVEVKLWKANNPSARDFRLETLGPVWTSEPLVNKEGTFAGQVAAPESGWTAYMVELTYDVGAATPLKLTTDVRIIPDTLPHPAPTGRASAR